MTSLLDKDKKFMMKYLECQDLLDSKRKELEDVRLKLNQDIEEKKIKISQILTDNSEIKARCLFLEEKIEELNDIIKNTNNHYIEYATQIKILKSTLQEKVENIYGGGVEIGLIRATL